MVVRGRRKKLKVCVVARRTQLNQARGTSEVCATKLDLKRESLEVPITERPTLRIPPPIHGTPIITPKREEELIHVSRMQNAVVSALPGYPPPGWLRLLCSSRPVDHRPMDEPSTMRAHPPSSLPRTRRPVHCISDNNISSGRKRRRDSAPQGERTSRRNDWSSPSPRYIITIISYILSSAFMAAAYNIPHTSPSYGRPCGVAGRRRSDWPRWKISTQLHEAVRIDELEAAAASEAPAIVTIDKNDAHEMLKTSISADEDLGEDPIILGSTTSIAPTGGEEAHLLESPKIDLREKLKEELASLLRSSSEQLGRTRPRTPEENYLSALVGGGGGLARSGSSSTKTAGLSKTYQNLMASTTRRQRFVTGQYPLFVTVRENPTRKWLGQAKRGAPAATSEVLINGTSIDKSLVSYDRFHDDDGWLDDNGANEESGEYDVFTIELLAEVHVRRPGYLNILPGDGAGSSGAAARELKEKYGGWNRWKFRADNPLNDRWWQAERYSDRLWITGFSLTPRGDRSLSHISYLDVDTGHMGNINKRTAKSMRWPNEVNSVPVQYSQKTVYGADLDGTAPVRSVTGMEKEQEDALLVADGFLVPGRDRGGLYIVRDPGNDESEWRVCLTGGDEGRMRSTHEPEEDEWFYHRAIWVDLTGDGRQSILTARAKIPSILSATSGGNQEGGGTKAGQLVWLECPEPHSFHPETGTPLDEDGTLFDPFSASNTPWKARVLDEGPDVMFSVADLDSADDTIELIASQFFSQKLSLHSIQIGKKPKVIFRRTLDERCGASFTSILANLDGIALPKVQTVVDSGSTVETLKPGDSFSHLLVTSHECTFADESTNTSTALDRRPSLGAKENPDAASTSSSSKSTIDSGSLFAYRVPAGKDAWKTEPWVRSIIATGFRVRGQIGNLINPGAPGFCYTFYPTKKGAGDKWTRPLIGIAGDCAEAAYILKPTSEHEEKCSNRDESTNYSLMCEIETGATVGSIGIGYDDFAFAEQQSGYAKIYVPCYEQNKVLVFALGDKHSNFDEVDDDW